MLAEKLFAAARSVFAVAVEIARRDRTNIISCRVMMTAAPKVPSPFPKSTEMMLLDGDREVIATARSVLPSPLKSPVVTESGKGAAPES